MPDERTQREQDSAKVQGVKNELTRVILQVGTTTYEGTELELEDDITPEKRNEVYALFRERVLYETGEEFLTLYDIAHRTIPNTCDLYETIAREVVARVGREMKRRDLVDAINNADSNILDQRKPNESYDELIGRLVSEFNEMRNDNITDKRGERTKRKDPDQFRSSSIKAAETKGHIVWTSEIMHKAWELRDTERYPEGHTHAGRPNLKEIARKLTEEFKLPKPLTSHQVKDAFRAYPDSSEG